MEPKKQILRFVYQQTVVRFTGQIREPYLIRIDRIFTHSDTNELTIAFHIANKHVNQEMPVADFVWKQQKIDMIFIKFSLFMIWKFESKLMGLFF